MLNHIYLNLRCGQVLTYMRTFKYVIIFHFNLNVAKF